MAGSLLVLALLVRIGYVLHTTNFLLREDAKSYDYLARVLAQGHGWGYGNSAYRPPGYPIFLAGVYLLVGIPHGVMTSPRLVEAFLATATVGLTGLMAWQLAGRTAAARTTALIAMAIAAVYLPFVLVGVAVISETLLVPLLLLATVCALQARTSPHPYRWIVLAGVFAGFAALTRGNGIVLAPALALVVWTRKPRRSWRSAFAPLLLLLVTALTISPWTIRNAYAQHAFIPVTTELGNTLKGTYNDLSVKNRFVWTPYNDPVYKAADKNKNLTEAQRSSRLVSVAFHYIGDHPLWVPEAMFWNTVRLLDLQSLHQSQITAGPDEDATAGVADAGVYSFWIVGVLAILGAFTLAARRVPRSIWAVPFILWLSVAPITTGTPRFRAALEPFVILLAAFGIQAIAAAVVRRRGDSWRQQDPGATAAG
jgi:4-amino-4-deoxy-L-arabinose transferase-like glycosyltransferase